MSDQHGQRFRILLWLRVTILAGALLIAIGVGGLLFQARQKIAAIDCLSGASPPSHWVFEQRGSELIRSMLGDRGSLMFLDDPRELTFSDVFTAGQAHALNDLPSLRVVDIGYLPTELLGELHTLSHLEKLTIGTDEVTDECHRLRASLPDCVIMVRYWDGSEWQEVPIVREEQTRESA